MRLKNVRGLPVIDPVAARKVGTVQDYLVDPTTGRVAALELKGGEGEAEASRLPGHQVRRVGRHAVILRRGSSEPTATGFYGPDSAWLNASRLGSLEVVGDNGNKIGRLLDAVIDQDTLQVNAYLLRTGPLSKFFNAHARIKPDSVTSCSTELMLIRTPAGSKVTVADTVATDEAQPAEILTLPSAAPAASLPAARTPLAS